MDKKEQLQELRDKHILKSREYLQELYKGIPAVSLKKLREEISLLLDQIITLEQDLGYL